MLRIVGILLLRLTNGYTLQQLSTAVYECGRPRDKFCVISDNKFVRVKDKANEETDFSFTNNGIEYNIYQIKGKPITITFKQTTQSATFSQVLFETTPVLQFKFFYYDIDKAPPAFIDDVDNIAKLLLKVDETFNIKPRVDCKDVHGNLETIKVADNVFYKIGDYTYCISDELVRQVYAQTEFSCLIQRVEKQEKQQLERKMKQKQDQHEFNSLSQRVIIYSKEFQRKMKQEQDQLEFNSLSQRVIIYSEEFQRKLRKEQSHYEFNDYLQRVEKQLQKNIEESQAVYEFEDLHQRVAKLDTGKASNDEQQSVDAESIHYKYIIIIVVSIVFLIAVITVFIFLNREKIKLWLKKK